jgi:hypothetical protein
VSRQSRSSKGKKLLVARVGAAALTFAGCAAFPGCNLMPPPSCEEQPSAYHCRDFSVPTEDLTPADDLRPPPGDGSSPSGDGSTR